MLNKIIIFVLLCCVINITASCFASSQKKTEVIKAVGDYSSPAEKCIASLKSSEMGGFIKLSIINQKTSKKSPFIDDVTGLIWLDDNISVISVSPIYGKPGIYLHDCSSMVLKQIFQPQNINNSYPNGADYFELLEVENGNKKKILFYYAKDVDLVDFNSFRTKSNVFQINIYGRGFKKRYEDD